MAFPETPCERCPVAKAGKPGPCWAQERDHAAVCGYVAEGNERWAAKLLGTALPLIANAHGTATVPDAPTWQPPESIGLIAKAGNLATATMDHVVSGLPVADHATQERRMELCRSCVGPTGGIDGGPGYWDESTGECRHSTCNCRMRIKTWWLEQKCPIGKW